MKPNVTKYLFSYTTIASRIFKNKGRNTLPVPSVLFRKHIYSEFFNSLVQNLVIICGAADPSVTKCRVTVSQEFHQHVH